ncbi:hypothetical protein OOZ35_01985 [Mesoflavibacter profundi]|uniref:Phage protein n=1 Tax=Mesoflavibacter profundi TaxID=2708110 RepID=A0ABT4RWN9_9FLAO|nr:hypothetical protein [Mesoflavibacter profundi]MDA0176254.1 hypothetical protein [Mesoflavibacter profundi]
MKKTEYFVGVNHNTNQLELAIKTATDKRDSFLKINKEIIAKIDNEEIILTTWQGHNQNVIPTIKLTYYTK